MIIQVVRFIDSQQASSILFACFSRRSSSPATPCAFKPVSNCKPYKQFSWAESIEISLFRVRGLQMDCVDEAQEIHMTISADNHENYGGNLINQKYSPLHNITDPVDKADEDFVIKLYNRRVKALSAANAFPKQLQLWSRPLPALNLDEAPMVVISSNRAQWVEGLFKNGTKKNTSAKFKGYDDATTFAEDAVAWYDPLRSGRKLFFVVHHLEWSFYKTLFAPYANV